MVDTKVENECGYCLKKRRQETHMSQRCRVTLSGKKAKKTVPQLSLYKYIRCFSRLPVTLSVFHLFWTKITWNDLKNQDYKTVHKCYLWTDLLVPCMKLMKKIDQFTTTWRTTPADSQEVILPCNTLTLRFAAQTISSFVIFAIIFAVIYAVLVLSIQYFYKAL